MKKNLILSMLTIAIGLIACQPEGRVYIEHQELSPEIEWLKQDSREFLVPIDSIDSPYNLSLSFRYANGYQFEVAKVMVTETSPSGKESVYEYELKVRDDKG
ncbi:gliding motility lipoprotein GldH, partial [Salibacteraceae bacterium]|nr:gliding motility lipoprotein GldH [Salibacteraceae bacterium]